MSSTSYAVLAKARSKFGKRLSDKDYSSLLACNSVAEVMSYLKSYTHYSTTLRDVNERDVHRGRLEALLRRHIFYEFDSLCKYDPDMTSGFSCYVVDKTEVEQIMKFLTLLNSGKTEKFIYQFPTYFTKHTNIDIKRLALAKTYDEFLNILRDSEYYDILSNIKPDEDNRLPISEIENKLFTLIFTNLREYIEKHTSGSEKRELLEMFTAMHDYFNFSRILRLKKYYNLPAKEIKNNLLYPFCDIKKATLDRMCNAETSAEIFSAMETTKQGSLIGKIGYVYASDISPRVNYRVARKNMHFSNNPSVVLMSYMLVSETELMNIISLIEGTRYKLDKKLIQSMLIY